MMQKNSLIYSYTNKKIHENTCYSTIVDLIKKAIKNNLIAIRHNNVKKVKVDSST